MKYLLFVGNRDFPEYHGLGLSCFKGDIVKVDADTASRMAFNHPTWWHQSDEQSFEAQLKQRQEAAGKRASKAADLASEVEKSKALRSLESDNRSSSRIAEEDVIDTGKDEGPDGEGEDSGDDD